MSYYEDRYEKLRTSSGETSPTRHYMSHKYETRYKHRVVNQVLAEPDENNNVIDQVIEEEYVYHPPVNRRLFDTPKHRKSESTSSSSSSPEDCDSHMIGQKIYNKKRQFTDVFEQDIEYDHKRHKIDTQDEEMCFEHSSQINSTIKLR